MEIYKNQPKSAKSVQYTARILSAITVPPPKDWAFGSTFQEVRISPLVNFLKFLKKCLMMKKKIAGGFAPGPPILCVIRFVFILFES